MDHRYSGIGPAAALLLSAALIGAPVSAKAAEKVDLLEEAKELYDKIVAPAPSEPYWYVQTSVATAHFKPQPDHNNNQDLIGVERHRDNSYLWGAATFRHSFGVRSYYAYGGKRIDFQGTPFNAKITAGLLHGYRGEYKNKIPLNRFGIAPAIVPSVGASFGPVGVDVLMLGAAAAMVNVGFKL